MKLVTFNIRCDYHQDGNNCFENRRELIRKKIMEEAPHIICFQEVLPHVALWLKENLSSYYILGCGRTSQLDTEQMCIAYRREAFQLISMNTFWLSETPDIPGSRYDDQSDCPRTATELLLQDLTSKRIYYIINTHLDHLSSSARILGMSQILRHMKDDGSRKKCVFPEMTMLLAGDFNAFPDSEEIGLMLRDDFLVDLTDGMEGTFHDYGKILPAEKIDYIAATPDVYCKERGIYHVCENGVYLSDHYPVYVDMEPVR